MRPWQLLCASCRSLAEFLAPSSCAACEAPWTGDTAICPECGRIETLRDIELHVDDVPVYAGARYGEPLASAIVRFKYKNYPELASGLAQLMLPGSELLGVEPGDVWVPVPLHAQRLAERGYNQAALLARELARRTAGRVAPRALARLRDTAQQAKQDRAARQRNVAGAFVVRRAPSARVILVDDVVTTGSTLRACIAALKAAGCLVLGCVAVARAE
ncbi:MAG TPA: ComF family protein [Polyangiaceae bacterium]|jgi:ComF family protein